MTPEEFGGLEPLGKGFVGGLLDHPGAGEADHGAGLGDDDVGERGEAGRHAAHGWIGHQGEIGNPGFPEPAKRGGGLRELHQGEHALLHPGAARGRDDQERQVIVERPLDAVGDLFTGRGAHAAAHEGEVETDDHQPVAGQRRFTPADRLVGAGRGAALLDPLGVGLRVLEAEDVLRRDLQVLFVKGARLDQHRDPLRGAQPEVVAAAIADAERGRQPGRLERRIALWAGKPVDLLADAGAWRR